MALATKITHKEIRTCVPTTASEAVVHWTINSGGHITQGHGQPIDDSAAQAWARPDRVLNTKFEQKEYGEFRNCVPTEDGKSVVHWTINTGGHLSQGYGSPIDTSVAGLWANPDRIPDKKNITVCRPFDDTEPVDTEPVVQRVKTFYPLEDPVVPIEVMMSEARELLAAMQASSKFG